MKTLNYFKALCVLIACWGVLACSSPTQRKILVFSKTAGFRHDSIEEGIKAIQKMADEKGFAADFTEDSEWFVEKNLKHYHAVVFLNTTGDVLNNNQQESFERYIQAGGGYVGVHAATDTEYDWPWYGELAGAYFLDHPNNPNVQKGTFEVVNHEHPATKHYKDRFDHIDEFYNFKNLNKNVTPLIKIDEKSYNGGKNGDDHPMSWYHEYDGGRAFYTAMGHTKECFTDPDFLEHLWGGIFYASGEDKVKNVDFSKSRPEENRFSKVVLAEKLDEPTEMCVLDNDRILFIQRKGEIYLFEVPKSKMTLVAKIPVSTKYRNRKGEEREAEDGLLGLSKDPNFATNNWIYLYYSTPERSSNVLARFEFKNNQLNLDSKKELLEVPVQREECCHTGGSIAWDRDGNLYLSTGDNTNPFGSNGYSPSDERPGRAPWDAQGSSANTNDLRGKILRIKPLDNGTYAIPEGNLFAKGTPNTRPEIYTMGHRNPYRISVDQHNGYLYWGDVGPDAKDPDEGRGPAGHDEFGQAKGPGNFGWPHFIADNKAYNRWDYENNVSGPKWDPKAPINSSPNNTGLKTLPPAQPAFIWYPYGDSPEFPLLKNGGRNAMAGPVYYEEDFKGAARKFPSYYDKKVFIYEWMRGMIFAVTLDEKGNYKKMERFMPNTVFNNPMDMEFAPNGDLYMLEYGTGWFVQNDNARLVRIEYNGGNRNPKVVATSSTQGGSLPLKVDLSSAGSEDLDGDDLSFKWTVSSDNGYRKEFKQADVELTLTKPGIYNVELLVSDHNGGESKSQLEIIAGNDIPKVEVDFKGGNGSFYTPNKPINYAVLVQDKEDGTLGNGIDKENVVFNIDYLAEGFDKVQIAQGHKTADDETLVISKGKKLIDDSDCKSCHDISKKSAGPTYSDIAKRYARNSNALNLLADKIRNGGSGNWGEIAMSAHPSLSEADAKDMVKYILNLNNAKPSLPLQGTYAMAVPKDDKGKGTYIIRASYLDKGANGLKSLKGEKTYYLRNAQLDLRGFDSTEDVMVTDFNGVTLMIISKNGAHASLKNIDLKGIKAISIAATAPIPQLNAIGGFVEARVGGVNGPVIGTSEEIKPSDKMSFTPNRLTLPINPTADMLGKSQDIYLVFKNSGSADGSLMVVMGMKVIL